MKSTLKTEMIQPLLSVARRYSSMPEYATLAAAYVAMLAARQGMTFPLPELRKILAGAGYLPAYVRSFIEDMVGGHWSEYQQSCGAFDEEMIADFFAAEAICLLMEAREDSSVHPAIDNLCTGLLKIKKGDSVADLNCGIGKFVQKSWFALWNAVGSDEGLSVVGYTPNSRLAAIAWIVCDVDGVKAKILNESLFTRTDARYDKVMVVPPFGFEARQLNILEVADSIAVKFEKFPEVRLSSAEWLFAARAAALLKKDGRAIVAMPMNALNGAQSEVYREHLIRKKMIEAVISIPAKHFMNGTGIGFAIVVLHDNSNEIKFVNGEEYYVEVAGSPSIDVPALLRDYDNLNDFDAVTTRQLDSVFASDFNLTPDYYLGDDLVYNNSSPIGEFVQEIKRGAKLTTATWKKYETAEITKIKKVAFKNFGDGLVDEELPGLSAVPEGAGAAVLQDGDLIISRMGIPFKMAVVQLGIDETLVADENVWICRMRGDKRRAYFLRAFLESEIGLKWLARLSTGATVRTISAKNLEKIPVPNLDAKTREVIAEELERNTIIVRENRKRFADSFAKMKNVYKEICKNGGY